MDTTPISPIRTLSRLIVLKVIADTVRGPVQCLPHADVLELRALLRDAYPFDQRKGYNYRVWSSEVRDALGYPVTKPKRWTKPQTHQTKRILPAMRQWAEQHGIPLEAPEPQQPIGCLDFSLK